MKDLMGVMKQMGEVQARMRKMQDELASIEIEGQAGAGLVKVVLSGKGETKKVVIDPSLAKPDEVEILEDLITAAAQDAKAKLDQQVQSKMEEMTGGLPIPPGLKLF
jgi:nucleoid-associated protein EbfC